MKKATSDTSPQSKASSRGFSIIELLVSGAIVAALGALGTAAYSSVAQKTAFAREMNAGKNLISAYTSAAVDQNGIFLRGLDQTADDGVLPDGRVVAKTVMARYPYRLAPYFNHQMEGIIVLNKDQKRMIAGMSDELYGTSLYPAFGMNCDFVGGNFDYNGRMESVAECITRQAQATGSILAFVSASAQSGDTKTGGYMRVEPPYHSGGGWGSRAATWSNAVTPANFGYVHPRHQGKAVAVFLDGSIKALSMTELADMRIWSKNASLTDNPTYVVPASGGGGGGGRR